MRAFFLLALALFVVKTVFELLFAVLLTYIFHKILCNFGLKWHNLIVILVLIIAAWFLAWPYVTNITNIPFLIIIIISVISIPLLLVAIIYAIKYRSFTVTTIVLIILGWLLAGPDVGAIINIIDYTISSVRQMIYPGDVAALLGMWPFILLLSLLLFYIPAVHQDRRCLAS